MTTRGVAVLGSTGSVGTTALRVLARHRDRFHVAALTSFSNTDLLAAQASEFHPSYIGVCTNVERPHPGWIEGTKCLVEAATRSDVSIVINAVVGAAGLDATLAAVSAGKRVALANKETLVMAGTLVAEACRMGGGELVPVDSEHSAILQCLAGRAREDVRRLVLTASGGPFRSWTPERLATATIADALQHPTWKMGRKISIDSATLANKALEVIEAHFLFGLSYEQIEVVVHPQSIVHSFVEFVDGSVLAQMGTPSMELPVLYALTHPDRVADNAMPAFDPVAWPALTFERVRTEDFPALVHGIAAGRRGGAAPAVFNAANEQAVSLFLENRIRFMDVARAIASALASCGDGPANTRAAVMHADAAARRHVLEMFAC